MSVKGESLVVNGDRWTIVDVAPAAPLAEMVAALLEEEGFLVMTRGTDALADAFSHLGALSVSTTYTLVPEPDAERALALLAETVTDYEGDELDALMAEMEAEGFTLEQLEAMALDPDGADAEDDEENGDDRDGR